MGSNLFTQNPFGLITFVVGPAILTSATCALIASTVTRSLRAFDRVQELEAELLRTPNSDCGLILSEVGRLEVQAGLLLASLRWFYLALGSFSASTLITLLGAISSRFSDEIVLHVLVCLGLLLGGLGVTSLIFGSFRLMQTTHLSLLNICERAAAIKSRGVQNLTRNSIDSGQTNPIKPNL